MKIKSICVPSFQEDGESYYCVGYGGITEIRDTSPSDTNRCYDVYKGKVPFATLENCPVIIQYEEAETK